VYAVREARSTDLESLPQIEHAAAQLFASTLYPEIAREAMSTAAAFEAWLKRGALFVAVAASDEPVGFAIAFELDGAAHLHEIDVDPRHGRRGVGRQLIEYVKAWALLCGHDQLTLTTFKDVPWNAPYYRRLGFRDLPEAQAGLGLRALREKERANGLKVEDRLFMVVDLSQPN
jgi:GNAT superfamily N-acetyltransferase